MKAILRTKKHKTKGTLAASSRHTFREEETPNADPARTDKNRLLIGTGSIDADVHQRIKDAGITPGKNSVLAVEFMLTASPEYFEGEGFGDWDQKKTDAFIDASRKFMHDKYGDNVVSLAVHLDEKTPHLVGHVVPINPKTNRLSAKATITGGREMLRKLQDDFAESVQHLGLERGMKGSKAEHKSIKKWYAEGNQAEQMVAKDRAPKIGTLPPRFGREKWLDTVNANLDKRFKQMNLKVKRLDFVNKDALRRAQKAEKELEALQTGQKYIEAEKRVQRAEQLAEQAINEAASRKDETFRENAELKSKVAKFEKHLGIDVDLEIDRNGDLLTNGKKSRPEEAQEVEREEVQQPTRNRNRDPGMGR